MFLAQYSSAPSSLAFSILSSDGIRGSAIATTNTIFLPPQLEIIGITIAGEPVDFQYSWETGELVLPQGSYPVLISYKYLPSADPVVSTDTTLETPQFLKDWNYQDTAEIQIGESLEGHRNLTLEFKTYKTVLGAAIVQLTPGTIITLWDRQYRIADFSYQEDSRKNTILITLQCRGIWEAFGSPSESRLDKPLTLIEGNSYQKYRSLGSFAGQAGVSYQGANINKRISRATGYKEFTTLRQELENKSRVAGGFVYYSRSDRVEIRQWGAGAVHYLPQQQVYNEITCSVGFKPKYRNIILNLDFDRDVKSEGVQTVVSFENAQSWGDVLSNAEDGKLPSRDVLRDSAYAFDNGGITKRAIATTTLNGSPIKEESWTYGYIYSSLDTYQIVGTNSDIISFRNEAPSSFWGIVSYQKTQFFYDGQGYLYRATVSGFDTARLKQESEAIEAINLRLEAIAAGLTTPEGISLQAQADAYTFNEQLPINEVTSYGLASFKDFYSDIESPKETNPFWVEPKFATFISTYKNDYLVRDDPASTEENPLPPIRVSSLKVKSTTTTILSTATPERFLVRTSEKTQTGQGGKNAFSLSSASTEIGRPPVHSRLETALQTTSDQNEEIYGDWKFWVYSSDSNSDFRTEEGTLSYSDVDTPGVALSAANTEYAIALANYQTISLACLYQPNIEVGDTIIFRGEKFVLLGLTELYRFKQYQGSPPRIQATMRLTLGKFYPDKLELKIEK